MARLDLYLILTDSTQKPMSYLDIPSETLRESLKNFELAEKRADKRERLRQLLSKGPMFEILPGHKRK